MRIKTAQFGDQILIESDDSSFSFRFLHQIMWKPISNRFINRETLNKLSYEIRGAFFEVNRELGPGLYESVYEAALLLEFRKRNISVQSQVMITPFYKGEPLAVQFKIDILVEDLVIIELKSVDALHDSHFKQVTNYLRLADKRLGYLVNFNCSQLVDRQNMFRIVHNF